MTMFDTLTGPSRRHAPGRFRRRLRSRILGLAVLHRERAGLEALDDRMLRDIGLTRADIRQALDRPREHYALILRRGCDEL